MLYRGGIDETGSPILLGATVERLAEELSPDRVPNARLLNVILLTFRCAFKPKEFYNALVERWAAPAPADLAPEQWKSTRQAIRLRLLNVFKVGFLFVCFFVFFPSPSPPLPSPPLPSPPLPSPPLPSPPPNAATTVSY